MQTGHLLTLIKQSKEFAKGWLKTSQVIRQKLKSNATQKTLETLLIYSNKYPYLLRDWVSNISEYQNADQDHRSKDVLSYNKTVLNYLNQSRTKIRDIINELKLDKTGSSKVLGRMEFIDRVATAWITILQPIKLDIFYGFPSEKALTDYYRNVSKRDDFKKYVHSGIK